MRSLLLIFAMSFLSSGIALASSERVEEAGLFDETESYHSCDSVRKKGYDDGYRKGHRIGYNKGKKNYDCRAEKSKSYNDGYALGMKHDGGYDGGYNTGYKVGYEGGYTKGYDKATGDYSSGVTARCAFVFKFDGFILTTDDQCSRSDQCEDDDANTVNVCLVQE